MEKNCLSKLVQLLSYHRKQVENITLKIFGLLNSSISLLWARQTFFPRGGYTEGKWQERMNWNGTPLFKFPIPKSTSLICANKLDEFGRQASLINPIVFITNDVPSAAIIEDKTNKFHSFRQQMIGLQEELDWQCYNFYKITDQKLWMPSPDDVPPINLGERAFEIVMARKMRTGDLETAWFERHGSTPQHGNSLTLAG